MVIIALTNQAKKINRILNDTAKWCYIGKDVIKRQKIAAALGMDRRFYLRDRLYDIAWQIRLSYVDFVAQAGKEQKDRLNWWASKFASKSPFHTDFFLFVCYEALIKELIKEKNAVDDEKLVIFVEDPWLFFEVKNLIHNKNVRFIGCPNLSLIKLFYFVRGLVYRLFLVGWVLLAKLFIRFYHNGKNPKALETKKNVLCIINPVSKTLFKNGKYVSNRMPGLSGLYEENGIPYFHLYPFPFPLSTVRHVGRNQKILWPLIVDVQFSSVVKRIFERWNPIFKSNALSNINGCRIRYLLEREKWITFSKVGFNFFLIQYDALNKFFSKKWCSHLIYLFENQPWEKMLCISATKNNVKTIGYQHSSICKLYISQFIGKGEESFVPLPDKIVTAGNNSAELYKEGGIPEDRIVIGGAWRYGHMIGDMKDQITTSKKRVDAKQIILVSLPVCGFILKSMLENLVNVFSKNCLNDNLEVWLKPHPETNLSDLAAINRLSSTYHVTHKPFPELLKDASIIIVSTSTSGLESFLCGKKVISYIPENIIVPDPLLDITNERIYKWYEGEDFDTDFLRDFSSASNLQDLKQIRKSYFSEINHEVWLNLLTSKN